MKLLQCALYVALIGLVSLIGGQMLPRSWFDPNRFPYRSFEWELSGAFYRKLGIRDWKDKMPDSSRFIPTMFRKDIPPCADENHLQRLIEETCVAEFIHTLLIVLSLGVLKIWKGKWGWFCWGLCILGNLPFIFIQRYNRPRLQSALSRLQEKNAVL